MFLVFRSVDSATCASGLYQRLVHQAKGTTVTWNGTLSNYTNGTPIVLTLPTSKMFTLADSTNLLCVPQYGLQATEATYLTEQTTGSRRTQVREPNSTFQALEGVTSQELSQAILDSMTASTSVISFLYPNPNSEVIEVNDPSELEGGDFPTHADGFFTTMTQQYPATNGSDKSIWFDTKTLQDRASPFFGSVAAQFASQYLRSDDNNNVAGTATVSEPRLVLSSAVFYATEGLLAFLTLAILGLALYASEKVTPIDPASIGGTTAVFCADSELIDLLRGKGSYSLPALRRYLAGEATSKVDASRGEARWWRPFVFRPVFREIILLIPVVVIVVLEITLHISQKHNGLVSIKGDRYKLTAARLVSAAVFLGIATSLASLAFNISLLNPLSTLRKGPSAAHLSLFDIPLARFSLQNLWSSARRKQTALFCSILMRSAAFFLVTVSSGLFIAGDYQESINLTQLSWFNLTLSNNDSAIHGLSTRYNLTEPLHHAQDNGQVKVYLIGNGIVELNLSYPAWTYDELAFPQFVIPPASKVNATNATSLSADIPALRAGVQCTVLKQDQYNLSYEGPGIDNFGPPYSFRLATVTSISLSESCASDELTQNYPIGQSTLAWLPPRLDSSKAGSVAPRPWSNVGIYCSNLVGLYGYATDEALVNHTLVSCKVSFQQVRSTVTFDLPNYAVSRDVSPVVDESSAKTLQSSDVSNFLDGTSIFPAFYNTSLTTLHGYAVIDQVTAALIYGTDGIPAEQIFLKPPEEYLIPSLTHFTRVLAAQWMSYYYRTANSSLPLVGSTIPATLQMGPNYRLKQNATSTRILDGLLAAAFVFAVISVYTFRVRDVAKARLGTLAATLALVADSEFMQDLQSLAPSGAGAGTAGERQTFLSRSADIVRAERELSSKGYQFSLGWWRETTTTSSISSASATKITEHTVSRRWGIDVGRAE